KVRFFLPEPVEPAVAAIAEVDDVRWVDEVGEARPDTFEPATGPGGATAPATAPDTSEPVTAPGASEPVTVPGAGAPVAAPAAPAEGARVHTNSWHDEPSIQYNQLAADLDTFAWNNEEHLILGSAGNRFEQMGPPGTAKNVLSVAVSRGPAPAGFGDGATGPA